MREDSPTIGTRWVFWTSLARTVLALTGSGNTSVQESRRLFKMMMMLDRY